MSRHALVLLLTASLLMGACGGDDNGGEGGGARAAGDPAPPLPTDPALLGTTDFEQVCGGGTVSLAEPYDKSASGIHPVLVFEGQDPEYEYVSLTLPEGWQASALEYANTQLVACLNRVDETRLKVCEDYESDDFPEPFDVELYGATWEVTLYEANTGEQVASGEITADDKECPILVFHDEDEDPQREYADQSDLFRGFVKEHVTP